MFGQILTFLEIPLLNITKDWRSAEEPEVQDLPLDPGSVVSTVQPPVVVPEPLHFYQNRLVPFTLGSITGTGSVLIVSSSLFTGHCWKRRAVVVLLSY